MIRLSVNAMNHLFVCVLVCLGSIPDHGPYWVGVTQLLSVFIWSVLSAWVIFRFGISALRRWPPWVLPLIFEVSLAIHYFLWWWPISSHDKVFMALATMVGFWIHMITVYKIYKNNRRPRRKRKRSLKRVVNVNGRLAIGTA